MKLYKAISVFILLIIMLSAFQGCKKQDSWLDEKRQLGDVKPTTLKDFQAILDNVDVMNLVGNTMGQMGTDNYYLIDASFNSSGIVERNSYKWATDIFEGKISGDWNDDYKIVEYSNIVLDGLKNIEVSSTEKTSYENIKGSALFFRAFAFYQLAQLFCSPYSSSTADTELGIPIRLTSDVNVKSVRSSVKQTYEQMVVDLQSAIELLPDNPSLTTRPSKISASALLAKIFLCMEDYENAYQNANISLTANNTLIDYNTYANVTTSFVFPAFSPGNPEIIFFAYGNGYYVSVLPSATGGKGFIDSLLYKSYHNDDLRKKLFYQDFGTGRIQIRGTYSGTWYNFSGIANNEIYLIRAECAARMGNAQTAINDLNTLLRKRYVTGKFTDLTAVDANDALDKVLRERRKELPFTGQLRWEDLRRLNKDPKFAITLKRVISGATYSLPPNDSRYVYPIPDLEIQLSGIAQNPR
jgi:starch-binding outer membrane protein, SusD/RagB family